MRAAKDGERKTGRFAVRAGLKALPDGEGIEDQHVALHLQEAFDQALGRKGLAPAFLAENGDIGIERRIGDRVGGKFGDRHGSDLQVM